MTSTDILKQKAAHEGGVPVCRCASRRSPEKITEGLFATLARWLVGLCWLIAAGASAQVPAPDPLSFEFAIERGDLRKVRDWLDAGLNAEYQAAHIGTGLMVAAWYGNIEMMALFVERGADVRRANRYGEQPLQLAAWNGHHDAVRWLLDHGAPLEREGRQWGALHYAVFNGHGKVADDLLARGANVNARAPNGATPLMLAAREGQEALARVLLESGADAKLQSDWGDTPLTMAMRYDHLRIARMISSPEEFAIAVKAPKESFGEATRSAAVPAAVEAILREIRLAESEGRPSEELHRKLREAMSELRRASPAVVQRPMPRPYQPPSMVITARRAQPGAERAQLVVDGAPGAVPRAAPPGKATDPAAVARTAASARAAELLRQIRVAEAQGKPTDELRRQLAETVETLKP
ncbi:ankyrin repeat domain-containing protein [Accumulibacter sp.]|uniref:ankyrin repeat domain-containing protein n=1 Tax=Accumulibacter sp. TaxID=2053492 RepID=UPI0025F0A42B|nr:ankyrin repeat domain-containing protein [Accumulibacter sp.]MCM8596480.1 ankyrin repeat domain-containing protein [Accumulibacter sp.]MCM8627348.1 ankyrin repeat domain-containing protein [Accumulibacter sp.]MDS4050628.1 ankyrin repeat domain-containing protein [Accumulibacter sp.]